MIQKTREMRRGVYHPHLYVVKEDGEPPLRLWALSCLIQDRADVLPSYQQFISQLRDKVCSASTHGSPKAVTDWYVTGEWLELLGAVRVVGTGGREVYKNIIRMWLLACSLSVWRVSSIRNV